MIPTLDSNLARVVHHRATANSLLLFFQRFLGWLISHVLVDFGGLGTFYVSFCLGRELVPCVAGPRYIRQAVTARCRDSYLGNKLRRIQTDQAIGSQHL